MKSLLKACAKHVRRSVSSSDIGGIDENDSIVSHVIRVYDEFRASVMQVPPGQSTQRKALGGTAPVVSRQTLTHFVLISSIQLQFDSASQVFLQHVLCLSISLSRFRNR